MRLVKAMGKTEYILHGCDRTTTQLQTRFGWAHNKFVRGSTLSSPENDLIQSDDSDAYGLITSLRYWTEIDESESFRRQAQTQAVWPRDHHREWLTDFTTKPTDWLLIDRVTEIRARLKVKGEEALKEAEELKEIYPDPIAAIVDLLEKLPGDAEAWREITNEPYG
jgi:hypothetical protein